MAQLPQHIRDRIDAGDQDPEVLELMETIKQINEVVAQARAAPANKALQSECARKFAVLKTTFDFLLYDIGRYPMIKRSITTEEP